ncbi:MAG: 3-hydroxyacyl-CoA dehydrogenase family protein [Chitinophagaceae bacterium]
MKVLLLADDASREEWLALPAAAGVQYQWLTAPGTAPVHPDTEVCIDLLFENTPERIQWFEQIRVPVVMINSVLTTLADIGENFIRINGWKTFLKRPVVEAACTDAALKARAEELFGILGRKIEWIPDIPGFITPRVVASIINEAWLALEEGVSDEEAIDTAMKMGTNYPYGPFEWGRKIGLQRVFLLLEALSKKQERYTPAALLGEKILV